MINRIGIVSMRFIFSAGYFSLVFFILQNFRKCVHSIIIYVLVYNKSFILIKTVTLSSLSLS